MLETGRPLHGLGDRFVAVAGEEAETLGSLAERDGGELDWDEWSEAFRRITRRVVLGDAAADDTELSAALGEMMSEANGMPGKTSPRYPELIARLGEYVAAAEPGSLVEPDRRGARRRRDEAGRPDPALDVRDRRHAGDQRLPGARGARRPSAQRARVLAELGDADGLDAGRVVGLGYLEGCLEEAMRLWPTTTMLSRETLAETEWGGAAVPAGTQVLIPNTFLHRDRDRHAWADRFAPERWVSGEAAGDWSFNHFSRGPQGCPGTALALLLGNAAALVRRSRCPPRPVELLPRSPSTCDPGRIGGYHSSASRASRRVLDRACCSASTRPGSSAPGG